MTPWQTLKLLPAELQRFVLFHKFAEAQEAYPVLKSTISRGTGRTGPGEPVALFGALPCRPDESLQLHVPADTWHRLTGMWPMPCSLSLAMEQTHQLRLPGLTTSMQDHHLHTCQP